MSESGAGAGDRDEGHGPARAVLRHSLATLAYRAAKAVSHAPPGFGELRVNEGTRTPGRILAHMGDLMEWGLAMARGVPEWHDSEPLEWGEEVERFFRELEKLDAYVASDAALGASVEGLVQGPVADALTHVGQIAMLRRMAGAPIRGENYFMAEIVAGRVGTAQAAPRREFD